MEMNPLVAAALGSIFRWILTLGAGFLVSRGIWTGEESANYVAAGAAALAALVWSLYQKYRTRITVIKALDAPPGTSEATLAQMPDPPSTRL